MQEGFFLYPNIERMKEAEYSFSFQVYDSLQELPNEDAKLLQNAQEVTAEAYAPYSEFRVGAIAKLANGQLVKGSNQENASFPVGQCAERVLLASVCSLYPNIPIEAIAISYKKENGQSDHPVAPCGLCRQTLQELEERLGRPIKLILGGMKGKVFVIPKAGMLLPLAFNKEELK